MKGLLSTGPTPSNFYKDIIYCLRYSEKDKSSKSTALDLSLDLQQNISFSAVCITSLSRCQIEKDT